MRRSLSVGCLFVHVKDHVTAPNAKTEQPQLHMYMIMTHHLRMHTTLRSIMRMFTQKMSYNTVASDMFAAVCISMQAWVYAVVCAYVQQDARDCSAIHRYAGCDMQEIVA